MAPKAAEKRAKLSSKANTVKLGNALTPSSSQGKRFDPLTAFKLPQTNGNGIKSLAAGKREKGKGRASVIDLTNSPPPDTQGTESEIHDERMWVDLYEPTSEAELAVHKKKVEDVRRWFHEAFDGGPSGKLKKYRRLLALTGPSGTAKTTTVRVIARELGFEIMEWKNAIGETSATAFQVEGDADFSPTVEFETMFTKFETFLNRASSYRSVFSPTESTPASTSSPSQKPEKKRQIILLDELPNILHSDTQSRFHAALESLVTSPVSDPPIPVVIVISDAGLRGESGDDELATGSSGWRRRNDTVVDVRTALSKDLLSGPYVTQISFNPIAPTLMTKALQALLSTHYASSMQNPPTKEFVEEIVKTSNGDIRSAIMALQFACVYQPGKKKKLTSSVLGSITRRENSMVLFQLMGTVLYNKRKGDPPNSSATAKEIQKLKDIDAQLKDPPKLPSHLAEHERKASRVHVNTLYADSPIDSSLYSLYIHQNYTQFCEDLSHCDGISDWLSWIDSGGEAWYQSNPYRFHLLTLGTIHSLPSPVPRRSQKFFKPAFFENLQKEKQAWDGVRDALAWISYEDHDAGQIARSSNWTQARVALECGGVLKARSMGHGIDKSAVPPPTHKLFSHLPFSSGTAGGSRLLDEDEKPPDETEDDQYLDVHTKLKEKDGGGWLDEDDIEES